jgi:PrtD family type I secretion system ABC transporter
MTTTVNLKKASSGTKTVMHEALKSIRRPLMAVGLFSLLINMLVLIQPLYMMNLFDRVLTSLSIDTLLALTLVTIGLLVSLGFIESYRSRLLVRIAIQFDETVGNRVFEALMKAGLHQRSGAGTLGQVEQIRTFLTGQTLVAFFDLPFAPMFLAVLFILHFALGLAALVSIIAVIVIGMASEWFCKDALRESGREARRASMFAENSLRNAEVVAALGMVGNLKKRWLEDHQAALDNHTRVSDTMAMITGTMKATAIMIQVLMMALAAYLVIMQEATSGVLFASMVLVARIVAPVQQSVSAWRGFITVREAYRNLNLLLQTLPDDRERLKLPRPSGKLSVERVLAGPPGTKLLALKGVNFDLEAGESLGIIGPSGSGKSTLARLLVGVWPSNSGSVRLDGADVHNWDFDDLGPYIGYLPQDIELFDGTIAENICRFGERDDEKILEAAAKVGLHELILQQPEGYETKIRQNGGVLSGGQRQRLGLARAIYGNPSLIVLDEPNSNLDVQGELALVKCISLLKQQGSTVVVITHNPRILRPLDKVLVLREGAMAAFGDSESVLKKVLPNKAKAVQPEDNNEEPATESFLLGQAS